jgi:glycosyltransferase involved in cell wall biosynthesis
MDISVIITAYNKGPYIKECLLGVLNLDFQGEFVEDGSYGNILSSKDLFHSKVLS